MVRKLIPLLVAAGALALAACSDTAAAPPASAPPATSAPPTTEAPEPAVAVDWDDPGRVARFDGGWAIRACEGDAPMLCVERDGVVVGVVEAAGYPVASFPELDPAGNDQDNLRALAAGYLETFRSDRAAGCGADYGFAAIEPASFLLGGTAGMTYGFRGTGAGGEPSELNLQYSVIDGDTIVSVVAAAYDEGGCLGRDDLSSFDSATLAEVRPLLEAVLIATPLPAV